MNLNTYNRNFKLFFEYLLFNIHHLYLSHKTQGSKNISLLLTQENIYYLSLHTRFSSIFYNTQLVDMFSYELPSLETTNNMVKSDSVVDLLTSVVVYNLHNLIFHERFFFFAVSSHFSSSKSNLLSITELYPNAGWLEREISELNGVIFSGKKDLRNLMLQYGDTSVPFQKAYPSIGLKEVFYDSINDVIVQLPISLQL
jgi:NADH:ubiquinone oxidoreductase subunit C